MRPVEKPALRDATGAPREFACYQDARDHLEAVIGGYCSYCGLCPEPPHTEHVQPKSDRPDLAREWGNLLLACTWCNSRKGHAPVDLGDYLWPDRDNTARAFSYDASGAVRLQPGLAGEVLVKARRTLDLLKLDAIGDRRHIKRHAAWRRAVDAMADLAASREPDLMRRRVVAEATATGFWPVWITVFADDEDMLARLTAAFPGTWPRWRDESVRPGGVL